MGWYPGSPNLLWKETCTRGARRSSPIATRNIPATPWSPDYLRWGYIGCTASSVLLFQEFRNIKEAREACNLMVRPCSRVTPGQVVESSGKGETRICDRSVGLQCNVEPSWTVCTFLVGIFSRSLRDAPVWKGLPTAEGERQTHAIR